MSDQIQNDDDDGSDAPMSELDALKARAQTLGLTFSPKIGLETLRNKVNAAILGETLPETDPEEFQGEVQAPVAAAVAPQRRLTREEREMQMRSDIRAEQLRLVRLRITNLNPSKAQLHGEIFTVANRYIGIVKKFVPYGEATDNGYHVPWVIYEQLKEREFLQTKTRPGRTNAGQIILDQKWVKEFALEVLAPLTTQELASLAAQQAAARGMVEA